MSTPGTTTETKTIDNEFNTTTTMDTTSPDNVTNEAANLIMGFPERKGEVKNDSLMFGRGEIALPPPPTTTINNNIDGQAVTGYNYNNMIMAVNPPPPPAAYTKEDNISTAEVVDTAVHELAEAAAMAAVAAAATNTVAAPMIADAPTTTTGAEEASPIALAAMQEAATIVMEAENQKKRKASEITTTDSSANVITANNTNNNAPASHNDGVGNNQEGYGEGAEVPQQQPAPKQQRAATTSSRTSWAERLRQLAGYKQQHGNLLIPIRYKLNPSLGKFVHNTREQYKLYHKLTPPGYKKKCSLTAERIQQLEALGFAWTTERTKKQDEGWSKRYTQLVEFKTKHGHTMVPHGYAVDPSFAEWCHRQRTTYASSMAKDGKPNPAIQKRMEQLRQLGFNFTVHSDKWMYHWEQLKAYKEQQGDCQVPTHYSKNSKLGRWVNTQRHQRRLLSRGKKSCMTQDRIAMLDQLGFSWEVRPSIEQRRPQSDESTWVQRLAELKEYKSSHDDFIKVDPISMPQLFSWCHEQRDLLQQHHAAVVAGTTDQRGGDNSISLERIDDLAEIGFDKDVQLLDIPSKSTTNESSTTVEASNENEKVNDDTMDADPPIENSTSPKNASLADDTVQDDTADKDSTAEPPTLDNAPNPQLEDDGAGNSTATGRNENANSSGEVLTTNKAVASAKTESGVEQEMEPVAV